MIQQLKNKLHIMTLAILSSILLSFGMPKNNIQKYKISYLQDVTIEDGNKTIENYYAVFPQNNDTVIVYKTATDDVGRFERKYQYTFENIKSNEITFVFQQNQESAEKLKIAFEKNILFINDDIYKVNDAYYNYLKQKVLTEKSILEIVYLAKEGLGDCAVLLEPLNKNWNAVQSDKNFRLISIDIKNKNHQTDDQYFQQQVKYDYDKSGNFVKADSENFKKVKNSETAKFVKYHISKNDERVSSEIELYQNKKTALDSISVKWEQFSTSKEYNYIKYQSNLKTKSVDKKPKADKEIVALFAK